MRTVPRRCTCKYGDLCSEQVRFGGDLDSGRDMNAPDAAAPPRCPHGAAAANQDASNRGWFRPNPNWNWGHP